jgi:hypothetical protein
VYLVDLAERLKMRIAKIGVDTAENEIPKVCDKVGIELEPSQNQVRTK